MDTISSLFGDIEEKGGKIKDFQVFSSGDSPHGRRNSTLLVDLASSESVGMSVSADEAEANRTIATDSAMLMAEAGEITRDCDNIAAVSIQYHELGSSVYMHNDGRLKEVECLEVGQQPSWGKRICT